MEYVTLRELARELSVNPQSLRNYARNSGFPKVLIHADGPAKPAVIAFTPEVARQIRDKRRSDPRAVENRLNPDAVFREYTEGCSAPRIAARFGVTKEAVYRILKARGVESCRGNSKYHTIVNGSRTLLDDVVAEYTAGDTASRIAERYGITVPTVYKWIKRRGVPPRHKESPLRRYSLREDVFDTVNEQSAYWVGFLMADGCISSRANRTDELIIGLAARDEGHVEKFRNFLGSNCPIRYVTSRPLRSADGQMGNPNTAVRFTVSSAKLCESLRRFGVVPRKSKIAKVIGLESNRDFWRGAVDGDGCIYLTDNSKRPNIELCGSWAMVHQFRDFVTGIDPTAGGSVKRRGSIGVFCTNGRKAVRVIEALYSGCTVALDRKLALALNVLNDTTPYRETKYPDLCWEDLASLYHALGTWTNVASHLGMSPAWLSQKVNRLAPKSCQRFLFPID